MEDVLSATGKGGSYLAAGAVTGGLGKAAGESLSAVATVGNGAAKVEHQAAQAAHAAKVAKTANQVEHAADAVKAEQKAAQATHAAEQGAGQSKSAKSLLKQHEADGGHTLDRHTNKTDNELRERIKADQKLPAASTFKDEATAERVVGKTLQSNQQKIDQWLKSGKAPKLELDYNGNEVLGRGIDKGATIVTDRKTAIVVLKKKKDGGYFVLTAYVE